MIAIEGLPISVHGAGRCIESAAALGIGVELFPAVSRYDAVAAMKEHGLKLNRRVYSAVSDEPIGDRAKIPLGKRWLTTPEVGCCLSHYFLWQKCASSDETIMILEHDIVFLARPPEMPQGALAMNLMPMQYPGTQAYIITPWAARRAVREVRRKGVQPSDEILWRTTLLSKPTADCIPAVVTLEDRGVSTIQFSRSDDHHAGVRAVDPWSDYSKPGS